MKCTAAILAVGLAAGAAAARPAAVRVVNDRGIWWLQAPDGTRFLSKGVDCVGPGVTATEYNAARPEYSTFVHVGDLYAAWRRRTLDRMTGWGFNTLGGWCETPLYAAGPWGAPVLHYQLNFGSIWNDLWAPDYETKAAEVARRLTAPFRDNPRIIGYFLDNEFGWGDDYFLGLYLGYADWMGDPKTKPGKRALIGTLRRLYRDDFRAFGEDFTSDATGWDGLFTSTATGVRPGRGQRAVDAWMETLAGRYYDTGAKALRAADPRHLLMGDRFRQYYPQGVARAARGRMDVISTNYESTTGDGWVSPVYFETLHALSGCPVMVGEYYATARENRSGNRNSGGEFTLCDTQARRAAVAVSQVRRFAAFPFVVGWHWFQWNDEPAYGRGDGEDYNMGLVDLYDEPYAEMTAAFTRVNAEADAIHAAAKPAGPPPDPWPAARQDGLTADGRLDEWDKDRPVPRALLAPAAGLAPFLDAWIAWTPDALWIAVRAYDFSYPQEAGPVPESATTWGTLDRLTLTCGPCRVRAACGLLKADGKPDGRQVVWAEPPPRGQLAPALGAHVDAWHYVWEAALPAARLGRERLAAGDRLTLALRVENRGEFERVDVGGNAGLTVVLADPAAR